MCGTIGVSVPLIRGQYLMSLAAAGARNAEALDALDDDSLRHDGSLAATSIHSCEFCIKHSMMQGACMRCVRCSVLIGKIPGSAVLAMFFRYNRRT